MWFYRLLFVFDLIVVAVLGYFFLDGLQYASASGPSAFWIPILCVPIGLIVAAWLLQQRGKKALATLMLLVVATPPILFVLFFGVLLMTNPRWN
ncbi:MAG: hypothetical protein ABI898_02955 [Sphingomonadales bacterium]